MEIGFIYNPKSGTGKINKYINWIKEEYAKAGHTIYLFPTNKPFDAVKLADENRHLEMLLVAGGDGTLSEVVNGLMKEEKRPYIGYIPTGTANDVGNMLGLSRNIKKNIKLLMKKESIRAMDITKINDEYFTYACATGKFAKASYDIDQKNKKRFKKFAYVGRGMKEAFKKYDMPIKVKYDNGSFEGNYSLVLFLNGFRVAGMKLFFLKKVLDDGLISARFFEKNTGILIRLGWFFLTGGFYDSKRNRTIISSSFNIKTTDDVIWNTDGEKSITGSVEIKVIPQAVKFIVNPKNAKKYFLNQ